MSASDPEIQTHSSVQFSYPVRFCRMPARLSQLWIYSLRRGDFTGFILTPEAFSQKITEIHLLSNSNEVGLFYFTETWLDDYIKDVKHSAAEEQAFHSWSMLQTT